jgi:RNA polymerase-associated protein RTF1
MSDEMEDELLEFFKEEEGNDQQQKRKREQEKEKRAVPLKKRSRQVNPTIEETPKEDSVGSDESSGNELYWDKEDKKLLLSLPEAKRERILYERAEKLKDQLETKHLSEEVKSKHKSSSQKPPSPAGTTAGGGKNRSHVNIKRASLDEIKALHNSKTSRSTKSAKRQMKEKEEDDYYEEESGDYTDEPLEAGEEDRTNNEVEEEDMATSGSSRTSENKQPLSPILPPIETLNELLPAVVKRSTLEKWYCEPYWERAILRLFVRVMIGQGQDRTYRIAEIMQLIDANYVYKFGKKECNQLVTLKIGDKTKNFELKYLSNESPTEDEFNSWKQWNISLNETLPSKLQIEHLEEQIKWADNYSYTDEDIERIVKKNKENNLVPINYTKEKIRLLDLIQQEKVNGHYDKISTYYQQLTELEHKEEEEINQKKNIPGRPV